ncbi:MAG: DUF1631 domain-containing protein [Gammaproteobacteria bacterium]|nr:MAG: DUF1631 domain-containing protein [Gammaproteobacteria bacterium]
MADHNVISFEENAGPAKKRLTSERHRRVVAAMRKHLEAVLPQLFQDLFDRLDDEFYELADKSANDLLQTRYFEAMRELRKLRQPIERGFVEGRLRAFERFWQEAAPVPVTPANEALVPGEQEMSLVDEADLEESLAIETLVSKANNRYHRTLFALNKRFAVVHGVTEIDPRANPVGPEALAEAFAEALAQWEGETAVRLIVYKSFDRHVMAYVGALYDELNDILVAHEVLPKIARKVRRNPVAPSVQRARDLDDQGGASEVEPLFDGGMLKALGELVAARRREDPRQEGAAWYARADAAPNLPVVSTHDLFGALGEVQRYSMNVAPVDMASLRELQAELMLSLGRELEVGSPDRPAKRLADSDRSMLDVIELLFDFILGDENLPEPMKALLGRLQIPMLKVGLMDRRFFSDPSHPARRLLNSLARAALAWTDDGDRSANSAYGRIESAVTRVLSDFTDDVLVFEQVYEEFRNWLEREQRNATVAEKRLAQAREGQEHLHLARSQVNEELQALYNSCRAPNCRLPEPVKELLDTGWRDVMLLSLLREGEQSEAWENARTRAKELVWSVQPKQDPAERKRLLEAIPNLLTALREGLNNISFDQHRAAALFKELQVCHIAALRGSWAEEVPVADVEEPDTGEASGEVEEIVLESSSPVAASEEPRDEYHEQAEKMAPGTWLEWTDAEGREVRGKLSWRSQLTGNCVFVDRRGMKIAEMTLPGVAALLRSGNGRILEDLDTPLMDRALNAMLDVLKRTDPEARSH